MTPRSAHAQPSPHPPNPPSFWSAAPESPYSHPAVETGAPSKLRLRGTAAAVRTGILSLLLLSVLTTALQAQTTVAGTVVSGLDNHPIPGATVDLLPALENSPPLKPLHTVTADARGRFSFPGIPPGHYTLRGQAHGFSQTSFLQHGNYSCAIITGAGPPTDALTLRLRPLGLLSGTVTDESAEPVRNAQVHLFYQNRLAGDGRIVPTATTNTDDLGRYEFPRLLPGTYFLAVTATPWYATHPNPQFNTPQFANTIGVVASRDPTLDVAYPVTYFPNTTDSRRASPILMDGNTAHADLQLTPVQALTLDLGDSNNVPFPQFQPLIFGRAAGFASITAMQINNRLTLTGIAPGDYAIRSMIHSDPDNPRSGFTQGPASPIHLTPESSSLNSPAGQSATLHITPTSPSGDPLPANASIQILSTTDDQVTSTAPIDSKHQAELHAPPGDYFLQASSAGRVLFARNLTVNNHPVPDNTLHLTPGADLTVTFTALRGTHTLRGVALGADQQPCPGALLLLIPAEAHPDVRLFFRQESDLDGSFDLPNLPAGPYLLLAFDQAGWDLDWRSPEALARFLPRSVPVHIPDTSTVEIHLRNPIPVLTP